VRLVQTVTKDDGTVVTFSGEVTPLPGNADIAVSHGVYGHSGSRSGVGKLAMLQRLKQIRDLGYSGVMCTVNDDNEAQYKLLTGAGWINITAGGLVSRRTDHCVSVWFKDLAGVR
jgi:hypothetical protein